MQSDYETGWRPWRVRFENWCRRRALVWEAWSFWWRAMVYWCVISLGYVVMAMAYICWRFLAGGWEAASDAVTRVRSWWQCGALAEWRDLKREWGRL